LSGRLAEGRKDPNACKGKKMTIANRTYTIRQLTKEFSVTARTLRFYEDEGLIAPERRGQTRIYSTRDRARIILILRGRRVGFSIAEIRGILDLYGIHDGGITQLTHTRKKFAERIETLERQKIDIDESLKQLRQGVADIDARLTQQQRPHAQAAE
jgi:DNA-binding transcriptional MerR regulator